MMVSMRSLILEDNQVDAGLIRFELQEDCPRNKENTL